MYANQPLEHLTIHETQQGTTLFAFLFSICIYFTFFTVIFVVTVHLRLFYYVIENQYVVRLLTFELN